MFSRLKYSRKECRKHKPCVVPVCPVLNSAAFIQAKILGNVVSFKVPPHYPTNKDMESLLPKTNQDSVIDYQGSRVYDSLMPSPELVYLAVCYLNWSFNGPWFMGPLAQVSMSFTVVSMATEAVHFNVWNAKAFQFALGDYLKARYGHKVKDGAAMYSAPMDWTVSRQLSVPAASFSVQGGLGREVLFTFPIGRKNIAIFRFLVENYSTIDKVTRDNKIIDCPMNEFINSVINSVTVSLSESTALEYKEISNGDSDMDDNFPPINWSDAQIDKRLLI